MAAYFSSSTCIKRNSNKFTRIILITERNAEHAQQKEPLFFPTR
jgi:hypothetical protein